MSDLNRVFLVGHVGHPLELKTSAGGHPYVRLSLATHTGHGRGEERTHWHRVVAFGDQAAACAEYLGKGSKVLVEGALESSSYDGPEGKRRYSTSVVAQRINFMGGHRLADVKVDATPIADAQESHEALEALNGELVSNEDLD